MVFFDCSNEFNYYSNIDILMETNLILAHIDYKEFIENNKYEEVVEADIIIKLKSFMKYLDTFKELITAKVIFIIRDFEKLK